MPEYPVAKIIFDLSFEYPIAGPPLPDAVSQLGSFFHI
jgi:hypothetical protein